MKTRKVVLLTVRMCRCRPSSIKTHTKEYDIHARLLLTALLVIHLPAWRSSSSTMMGRVRSARLCQPGRNGMIWRCSSCCPNCCGPAPQSRTCSSRYMKTAWDTQQLHTAQLRVVRLQAHLPRPARQELPEQACRRRSRSRAGLLQTNRSSLCRRPHHARHHAHRTACTARRLRLLAPPGAVMGAQACRSTTTHNRSITPRPTSIRRPPTTTAPRATCTRHTMEHLQAQVRCRAVPLAGATTALLRQE